MQESSENSVFLSPVNASLFGVLFHTWKLLTSVPHPSIGFQKNNKGKCVLKLLQMLRRPTKRKDKVKRLWTEGCIPVNIWL